MVRVPPMICLTWPEWRSMQGRNLVIFFGEARLGFEWEVGWDTERMLLAFDGVRISCRSYVLGTREGLSRNFFMLHITPQSVRRHSTTCQSALYQVQKFDCFLDGAQVVAITISSFERAGYSFAVFPETTQHIIV